MVIPEKLQLLLQNTFRDEYPQKNTQKVITFNIATLPTNSISFNMFSKLIPGTDKVFYLEGVFRLLKAMP